MFKSNVDKSSVIYVMVPIIMLGCPLAGILNSSIDMAGKVFLCAVFGILILRLLRMLGKMIKTIKRHKEIMKNGYITYGVVVLEDCEYYTINAYNFVYDIKVIMEDKIIRPFEKVPADSIDRVVLEHMQPGLIVKVKYYDNEILVMSYDDGIHPTKEQEELLERIRRTHGFNHERMWW